jgi:parallel beta-helix repeat protein
VFFKNHGSDPTFAVQPAIGFEAQSATSIQRNIRLTNNIFDYNGKGVLIYNASALTVANNVFTHNRDTTSANLRFEGGMSDVTVRDNLFYNNGARAIRIDQKVVKTLNQNFTITNNNFFGNGKDAGGDRTAIMVDESTFTGTLDATGNYFGATSGPSVNFVGGAGTGDSIFTGGTPSTTPASKPPRSRRAARCICPTTRARSTSPRRSCSPTTTTAAKAFRTATRHRQTRGTCCIATRRSTSRRPAIPALASAAEISSRGSRQASGSSTPSTSRPPASTTCRFAGQRQHRCVAGKFHLEVDGVNVSGTITPTSTGSNTTVRHANDRQHCLAERRARAALRVRHQRQHDLREQLQLVQLPPARRSPDTAAGAEQPARDTRERDRGEPVVDGQRRQRDRLQHRALDQRH